jgi:hypothetical protein
MIILKDGATSVSIGETEYECVSCMDLMTLRVSGDQTIVDLHDFVKLTNGNRTTKQRFSKAFKPIS